jgi:predicted nuclease of predicted toxin-antitoxin system
VPVPRTIRFHLDEHCPTALAEALRRHGVDVSTTPESKLLSATDEDQLAFAIGTGRVLFTQDADFLALRGRDVSHPGIVYCHQQKYSLGDLLCLLVLVWEVYDPEDLRDRIEYL